MSRFSAPSGPGWPTEPGIVQEPHFRHPWVGGATQSYPPVSVVIKRRCLLV